MLTLPIKKKWFDMIVNGQKHEEYRDVTPYYNSRFERYEEKEIEIMLRNGYSKSSPSVIVRCIPSIQYGGVSEWGALPNKFYWTLDIYDIVDLINIEDNKNLDK